MRGGSIDEKDFVDLAGAGFERSLDPVEQYVQQLIAQGYPEDTAELTHSKCCTTWSCLCSIGSTCSAAAPAGSGNAMYDQYYAQYYQQFVAQGYDASQ